MFYSYVLDDGNEEFLEHATLEEAKEEAVTAVEEIVGNGTYEPDQIVAHYGELRKAGKVVITSHRPVTDEEKDFCDANDCQFILESHLEEVKGKG